MTTTRPAPLPLDTDGWAPARHGNACSREDCPTCGGLGWVLCNHQGAPVDTDPGNADGHLEWCTRCDSPTDGLTWAWCPERAG